MGTCGRLRDRRRASIFDARLKPRRDIVVWGVREVAGVISAFANGMAKVEGDGGNKSKKAIQQDQEKAKRVQMRTRLTEEIWSGGSERVETDEGGTGSGGWWMGLRNCAAASPEAVGTVLEKIDRVMRDAAAAAGPGNYGDTEVRTGDVEKSSVSGTKGNEITID